VVLIKVELYFFYAFLILYGLVEVHFAVPEFPLLVCLLPFALLQVALGIYFTKTENTLGAFVIIVSIPMRLLNDLKYLTGSIKRCSD
jgi:hypothetical protein